MRDFIHAWPRQIQLVIVSLLGAMIALASVIYFNTPPMPHSQSHVGNVAINLAQFDYRPTYDDLQSLGLFAGVPCRKCDFGRDGETLKLNDFDDPSFMVSLTRYGEFLYLHFYSADASAGMLKFDALARRLRDQYPGRGEAMVISFPHAR
ncbi:MAG: hypothetical protein M3Y79_02360 [Pseudomonadota bacterium]|nr:hypothetical protein [Pseudomonadota bacterium]